MAHVPDSFWKHFSIFATYAFFCWNVLPHVQQPRFGKKRKKKGYIA